MRIDKWLWVARFFKTRVLAQSAVTGGKVHLNGARVKSSHEIHCGDEVSITLGAYKKVVVVKGLASKRQQAAIAQTLYEEIEESQRKRLEIKAMLQANKPVRPESKPNKQQRRDLIDKKRKNS